MKKGVSKIAVFVLPVFLLIIVILVVYSVPFPYNEEIQFQSEKGQAITTATVDEFLEGHDLIKDLPSDASVQLRLGDSDFSISKGMVESGLAEEPDMTITVPDPYIQDLNQGLCHAIQKAKANDDFEVDSEMSSIFIAWKYKPLLKYKSCLGYGINV